MIHHVRTIAPNPRKWMLIPIRLSSFSWLLMNSLHKGCEHPSIQMEFDFYELILYDCENADVTHLDMSEHGLHVDERA